MDIYKTVTMKDIREKKILLESKLTKLNDELDKVTGMKSKMTELSERNKNLELKLGTSEELNRELEDKTRAVSRELDSLRDTLSL
jgi:chromosome segregation ATPase